MPRNIMLDRNPCCCGRRYWGRCTRTAHAMQQGGIADLTCGTGGFGFPSLRRAFDIAPPQFAERGFGWAAPVVDVTEDEKSYKIAVELLGISEKDIALPNGIDRDKVSADFSKAVLTVTIPKCAEAQNARRTIEVEAS